MVFRLRKEPARILAERAFVRRVAKTFREEFTFGGLEVPPTLTRGRLEKIAEHCIEVARRKGFETERGIITFALHMFTIHPRFHEQPALSAILGDANIPELERLEKILRDCSDEEWDEAAAMGDIGAYWDRVAPPEPEPPKAGSPTEP